MEINNLVVVSDTHCGCQLGLCPPSGASLDNGGIYAPSSFQLNVWEWWREFWEDYVPAATKGEPYVVVHNGDAIDGVHHHSTTQITHNITYQKRIAVSVMAPVIAHPNCLAYYHIRGTEAHVGQSAQDEEALAKALGAVPNSIGQYARYELWKTVGPRLVHLLHHVGTTGSQAYEATAVHKELTESILEAGRWDRRRPDIIVRSHRHRYIETTIPTASGACRAVVTPSWQGKTSFAWRIPGARLAEPQFGGLVIRYAHGELFVRPFVKSLEREQPE